MIGQDELPAGKDWVLVECDGRMMLFITEGACDRAAILEEAWQAYRLLMQPALPRQRVVLPHAV